MTSKSKKTRSNTPQQKFWRRYLFIWPISIFLVTLFTGLAAVVAFGGSTRGANDIRYVEVYVDGQKQTVTTRSKTVGQLLEKMQIPLIKEDVVEPAQDSEIQFDDMQISIYRARPVTLIDGPKTQTILTADKSPRLIAKKAGLKLRPEDQINTLLLSESHLEIDPAQKIQIKRSKQIRLNLYGKLQTVWTTSSTIQELLDEKNIILGQNHHVQPSDLNSLLKPDQVISVNLPGVKTVLKTRPIAFQTEYIKDKNLEVGKKVVEVAGVDGKEAVIFEVKYRDGKEVQRRVLQTAILSRPVTARVRQGAKAATLSSSIDVSSSKGQLMTAAGISPSDFAYVDYIINHESHWRPGARNSSSGAYGLCQALPASKMASFGGDYLTNPVTQLKWCSSYARGRYGSWQGAYNAWLVQRWW